MKGLGFWFYFALYFGFFGAIASGTEVVVSQNNVVDKSIVMSHKSFSPALLPPELKNEKCTVCNFVLDGITDLLQTSCGHCSHLKCLQKRQANGLEACPACGNKIGVIVDGQELALHDQDKEAKDIEEVKKKDQKGSLDKPKTSGSGAGMSYEDLPEDRKVETCNICGDSFADSQDDFRSGEFYKTECGHYFHSQCLIDLQDSGKFGCPLCKTQLAKAVPITVQQKNIVFDSVAFEKIQLKSFIDFISDLKQMNYIPNADAGKEEVSLSVREPLTADQAYNVFLSVLELAGYAHIKVGDVYKIVKKDAKFAEPLPIFVGRPSKELPESDKTVRFVTFLKNLSVTDVDPILKTLLSPGAQQIPLQNLNGIVITDRCANIKSAMRVVNELDNAGYQEMVSLIKLKETNASEVKEFLEKLMKKSDTSAIFRVISGAIEGSIEYFPSGIKIIPDDRTNTLILLGMRQALKRVEDFIVNFVDKGLVRVESPLHIYECQHMDADSMKRIVDEVIAPSDGTSTASKFGGVRGGMKYFGPMKIEPDKFGNRLIVSCNDPKDWEMLKKMLNDLDKAQPQVSIETLVVEIDNLDTKELGGQIRNRSAGSPVPGVNFQNSMVAGLSTGGQNIVNLLGNLVGGVANLAQGETLVALGANDDVWALLRALNSQVRTSVISKPCITVNNRAQGIIKSGAKARIVGSQTVAGDKGYTNAEATTTIQYTPQINQEGLVNLDVSINITDFVGTNPNNTTTKNMTSKVTVADGQVMVMGGFVKTSASESTSKTPMLSSIPIIGWFFKKKSKVMEKTYTFFFVVTNIQKPRQTPGVNLYTKMKLHDAYDTVNDCVEMLSPKDPIHNNFFNPKKEEFAHKVIDFANARYQPTTVDLANDPYYKVQADEGIGKYEQDNGQPFNYYDNAKRIIRRVPPSGIEVSRDAGIVRLTPAEEDCSKVEKLRSLMADDAVKYDVITNVNHEVFSVNDVMKKRSSVKVVDDELMKKNWASILGMDNATSEEKRDFLKMMMDEDKTSKKNVGLCLPNVAAERKISEMRLNSDAGGDFVTYLNRNDNQGPDSTENKRPNELLGFINKNFEPEPKKVNVVEFVTPSHDFYEQDKKKFGDFLSKDSQPHKESFLKQLLSDEVTDVHCSVKNETASGSTEAKRRMLKNLLAQDDTGEI